MMRRRKFRVKSSIRLLTNWTIIALKGGKVAVQGQYKSGDRKGVWQSTPIVERKDYKIVESVNKTIYKLDGHINGKHVREQSLPAKLIKQFYDGFPENWNAVLKDNWTTFVSQRIKNEANDISCFNDTAVTKACHVNQRKQRQINTANMLPDIFTSVLKSENVYGEKESSAVETHCKQRRKRNIGNGTKLNSVRTKQNNVNKCRMPYELRTSANKKLTTAHVSKEKDEMMANAKQERTELQNQICKSNILQNCGEKNKCQFNDSDWKKGQPTVCLRTCSHSVQENIPSDEKLNRCTKVKNNSRKGLTKCNGRNAKVRVNKQKANMGQPVQKQKFLNMNLSKQRPGVLKAEKRKLPRDCENNDSTKSEVNDCQDQNTLRMALRPRKKQCIENHKANSVMNVNRGKVTRLKLKEQALPQNSDWERKLLCYYNIKPLKVILKRISIPLQQNEKIDGIDSAKAGRNKKTYRSKPQMKGKVNNKNIDSQTYKKKVDGKSVNSSNREAGKSTTATKKPENNTHCRKKLSKKDVTRNRKNISLFQKGSHKVKNGSIVKKEKKVDDRHPENSLYNCPSHQNTKNLNKGAKTVLPSSEYPKIFATKGTKKRKMQLIELMNELNDGYEDDIFQSTPFKKRTCLFGANSLDNAVAAVSISTPIMEKPLFEPVSETKKTCGSGISPGTVLQQRGEAKIIWKKDKKRKKTETKSIIDTKREPLCEMNSHFPTIFANKHCLEVTESEDSYFNDSDNETVH